MGLSPVPGTANLSGEAAAPPTMSPMPLTGRTTRLPPLWPAWRWRLHLSVRGAPRAWSLELWRLRAWWWWCRWEPALRIRGWIFSARWLPPVPSSRTVSCSSFPDRLSDFRECRTTSVPDSLGVSPEQDRRPLSTANETPTRTGNIASVRRASQISTTFGEMYWTIARSQKYAKKEKTTVTAYTFTSLMCRISGDSMDTMHTDTMMRRLNAADPTMVEGPSAPL
mmetsp:Transcript_52711/g.148474  ORF Transcript_52711/g.148474 Transcript_52711/m.148474 type:complete len:224 (+) Transcript_52711:763-1434(+)